MNDEVKSFGEVASRLARNPLGIIALFLVLVYSFACLVIFASTLSAGERTPLIYFLIGFPILVLAVFTWLVINHSTKLFGPGDYRNEAYYFELHKMQLSAVASLAVAASKRPSSETDPAQLVEVVRSATRSTPTSKDDWRDHILWVDDRPENNIYERRAFEAIGLRFTLAQSTHEALKQLACQQFPPITSDMGRREGPREGCVLLDALRKQGNEIPLFFYASSNAPEHKRETAEHGGQGCTNNAQELFQMVTRAVIARNR